MLKRPIVVNLIAAPGSGKSTIAAGVFEELKWRGINAELITEFAKDKVWEENPAPFKDGSQLYLLGKQFYRMNRCRDGVDVLITDSPLCLTSYYLRQVHHPEVLVDYKSFDRVVENLINSFDNLNYFLIRTKKYNPKGRFQTEEESDQMAKELKRFFEDPDSGCDYTVKMEVMDGNREAITVIADAVLEKIRSNKERAERRTHPDATIEPSDDAAIPEAPDPSDTNFLYALSKLKEMCMAYKVCPVTFVKETPKECFGDFWPVEKNSKLDHALGNFFRINYVIPELNKCRTMRELIDFIKKCQAEQKEP